jgi:hypothetical protein
MLDGFKPSWPAATAVPEAASVIDGCSALLEIAMVPVEAPGVWGAKLITNWVRCPGGIVTGNAGWLTRKTEPLALAPLMVMLEVVGFEM